MKQRFPKSSQGIWGHPDPSEAMSLLHLIPRGIQWHFPAPRSCWNSHSHTTSSSETAAPTPIPAAFPIFHYPRHHNPRQLRNFGLPFVGHAQTQCHLHPAVPVLDSPSLTTGGDPALSFPSHKLQELLNHHPGGKDEEKQWETPLGKLSWPHLHELGQHR